MKTNDYGQRFEPTDRMTILIGYKMRNIIFPERQLA